MEKAQTGKDKQNLILKLFGDEILGFSLAVLNNFGENLLHFNSRRKAALKTNTK